MMRKPIALLLSLILSLSINSTVAFAAPEPVKASTGMTDNSLTDELLADPLSTTINSSTDTLTEVNLSPVPVPDSDTKAVQSHVDGATLDSSVLEAKSAPPKPGETVANDSLTQEIITPLDQFDPSIEDSSEGSLEDLSADSLPPNGPIQTSQSSLMTKDTQPTSPIKAVELIEDIETTQMIESLEFTPLTQSSPSETPFKLKKTIVPSGNGEYTIRLEVYATADIAQAGQYTFSSYGKKSNQDNYDASENLWFQTEPTVYVPISVRRKPETTPVLVSPSFKNRDYFENRHKLFEKLKDGSYGVVLVAELSKNKYQYTFSDQTTLIINGNGNVDLGRPVYIGTPLFEYTYKTANGTQVELGRSTGAETQFETVFFKRNENTASGNPYETVQIQDSISDYMTLPPGFGADNIQVKTAASTGESSFGPDINYTGVTIGMTNSGKSIQISGFDFLTNYINKLTNPDNSISWRGKKLIIEYPLVVRSGFLGGHDVPISNGNSGVYKDSTLVEAFPQVTLDVAIPTMDIQLPKKNVYLGGGLTGQDLEQTATVKVGEAVLKLTPGVVNFGLAQWQTNFVEIQKKLTSTGNLINLIKDQTYSLEVLIKTTGTESKQKSASADIKVFRPKLVFKDQTIWTGDEAPTQKALQESLLKTQWVNENVDSTDQGIVMTGNEPTPGLQFELPESSLDNGLIATKKDIPVGVTLTIGSIQEKLSEPGLLLIVKTSQLTIQKAGGKKDETYVFNIRKGGSFYLSVSLTGNSAVTIYDLPVGTYSVEEEAAWSWRNFSGFNGSSTTSVKLTGSDAGSRATVISTNTGIKNNKWLNDYSDVSKNDKINIVLLEWNPAWTEIKRDQIIG